MSKRKQTNAEFKQDAVNYYYSSGKTLKQTAKDLKIGESTLGKWVAAAKTITPGTSSPGTRAFSCPFP